MAQRRIPPQPGHAGFQSRKPVTTPYGRPRPEIFTRALAELG
jgi:hypothetical protein